MGDLKVAIIGSGQVARTAHLNHYQSLPEVKVAAVCDSNLETARKAAEEFGIPQYFDNHMEMLETIKPDAVSVCVPNRYHCAITCDALEQGIHVLCEKPPALTEEEAAKMAETARKHRCLLTFGFHFRHSPDLHFLKDKIERGELGKIYRIQVEWLRRSGIPGWGNFTNKEMQGGGPLIDIGIHMLDLAVYLLDYPPVNYVSASFSDRIGTRGGTGFMGQWNGSDYTVEDSLFGMVVFQDGSSLNLETSFALNMKEKEIRNVKLYGDHQGASLFPLEFYGTDNDKHYVRQYLHEQPRDWHYDCIKNFVDSCRGEKQLLVTAGQSVYLQKMVSALYQSANIQKPVIF